MVWCPTFRRNLKDFEETQFISLLSLWNDISFPDSEEDARVWVASKDGTFSVSSFFKTILNNPRERNVLYNIWKLKAPPRVTVFGWLAPRKRIPTMDILRRRGMTIVNGCPLCLRYKESVDHLMLN